MLGLPVIGGPSLSTSYIGTFLVFQTTSIPEILAAAPGMAGLAQDERMEPALQIEGRHEQVAETRRTTR